MGDNIRLGWGVSRVLSDTIGLSQLPERRCLDLSIMQISILRQMTFPWAYRADRLVQDMGDYQIIEEQPPFYKDALEELEELLSGAYDGPTGGCPVAEIYHDRGDLPGYDYTTSMLTADGAWHELDLTNVIGDVTATRVKITVVYFSATPGSLFNWREAGNAANINRFVNITQSTVAYLAGEGDVQMSSNQRVDYFLSATVTAANAVIRGYWTPAV